jgi:Putative MetA-pathway of phenol degradation
MIESRRRGWSRGWCVVVLLPMTLSVACATSAGPAHVTPSSPHVENANAASVLDLGSTIAPIEPDRPDVTNGTNIVDVGLLQVEAGGQHARMGTQRSVGTPLALRIGLFEWLEARLSTDGFLHQADTSSRVSGVGNVQVGAKVRLFADPGGVPVVSILPTVNLPVASARKGLGSGASDVTVVVLTGTDLGRTSHIDFNYGIGAIGAGQERPHFRQHLVSVSASHSVTEQLSPYLEGYWFSKQDPDGGHVFTVDAGFIQAFTARWAVDGGVSVGLTKAAPDRSVFAGMSVIVGDVLGDHGVVARQRKAARLHTQTQR